MTVPESEHRGEVSQEQVVFIFEVRRDSNLVDSHPGLAEDP
jgi:hypothetical protein